MIPLGGKLWSCLKRHSVAFSLIILIVLLVVIQAETNFIGLLATRFEAYVENAPAAFATLLLAIVAFLTLVKDPISDWYMKPSLMLEPSNSKFPEDYETYLCPSVTLQFNGNLF